MCKINNVSSFSIKFCTLVLVSLCLTFVVNAQQPIQVGNGSYAEYTPLYKSKTDAHGGDKSRLMETRTVYIAEDKQGEPLPTNDWWTNLLVDTYSGLLWSYPQVVKAEADGVMVAQPNHWSSDGCEMKYDTRLMITGNRFHPAAAIAEDWSDWTVRFSLTDADKRMDVTMAQGMPFTWIETNNLLLTLKAENAEIYADGALVQFPLTADRLVVKMGNDYYGVYAPEQTRFELAAEGVEVHFDGKLTWLSVAMLPNAEAVDFFASFAPVVPRTTTVAWEYDEPTGDMTSTWTVQTENLNGDNRHTVLQGFLPHHYKNSRNDMAFLDYTYATPRGRLKLAEGTVFSTTYHFSGMLPWFAVPKEGNSAEHAYQYARMKQLIADYAAKGSFGADTYWGGKGLIQMALYMTFAKEMGEEALFEQCRSRLRAAMEDWLTYTPGEQSYFFARYNRWGALVGYDTSYDSDTFNDHHFHYGYFTYAGALLALVDTDFRNKYGDMLRLIAKDYANWDKTDKRFPFFRTFTPWSGHSYAGGLGNAGNGNGQESTSEAMQGWGGLYLLGVALGDEQMRDAGIFGWTTEAQAVAEYWFDRDKENINRSLYTKPYNSNLTSAGIGWWTWFSGDPVWMHSIQWMPISPCLDYLSYDLEFAKWDYEQMWAGKEIGGWEPDPQYTGSALSKESGLGNVVLSYLQRFDPAEAARIFDEMWEAGTIVARNTDTNGITYFITHSHLTYGDRDFSLNADIPTSSAYRNSQGEYTYVVYNPVKEEQTVSFYRSGQKVISFRVPAERLTVYKDAPVASSITIDRPAVRTVEPETSVQLTATVFDQYGTAMPSAKIVWTTEADGCTIDADGLFKAGQTKLSACEVKAVYGDLQAVLTLRVDEAPYLKTAHILPDMPYAQSGQTIVFALQATDQYGDACPLQHTWQITKQGEVVQSDSILADAGIGTYTVAAIADSKTIATQSISIMPMTSNLALHKPVEVSSEENAGTLAEYATDGDLQTRWGSAHTDTEYISVDLGKRVFVHAVHILWEASYAAQYELSVSDDGEQWTSMADVRGSGGAETTDIAAYARYVRINGKERASSYGYSLYELEVYGVDPDRPTDELWGVEILAPDRLLKEGETVRLTAKGFNGKGEELQVDNLVWSTDNGTVTAGGLFTPATYGKTTVKVETQGCVSEMEFVVEETIKTQRVELAPDTAEIVVGETVTFSLAAYDQFGAACTSEHFLFTCPQAPEMISDNVFTGKQRGTYEVMASDGNVSATAVVKVGEFAQTNLALGKTVYSSGYENNLTLPEFVNDGDLTTRWGSTFNDNQYIMVDLGTLYVLNRVVLHWNADAYATAYRVEVSTDEDTWTVVDEMSDSKSGTQEHQFTVIAARYVRVYCLKRANKYGSCIDEMEIYGTAHYEQPKPEQIAILSADEIIAYMGETQQLTARLTDQYGIDCTEQFDVLWSIHGNCAEIALEGMLTPLQEGEGFVEATCGSLVARKQLRVLAEQEDMRLVISPELKEVEVGIPVCFEAKVADQYGSQTLVEAQYTCSPNTGLIQGNCFTATSPGTYLLTATDGQLTATATIHVIASLEDNIAWKKPVTVSAGEDTKSAVNDENEGTRWISDEEVADLPVWLQIDLEGFYYLTRSAIVWERAAAADYEVQVSANGTDWETVDIRTDMPEVLGNRTDKATVDAVCRYVRIYCTRRATQWNYSVFEWRLYGRAMEADEPCTVHWTQSPDNVKVGEQTAFAVEVRNRDNTLLADVLVDFDADGGNMAADGTFVSLLPGLYHITARAGLVHSVTPLRVHSVITSVEQPVTDNDISVLTDRQTLIVRGPHLRAVSVYAPTGALLYQVSSLATDEWQTTLQATAGVYVVVVETADKLVAFKRKL